jgi:phosphoglycolate phosphatase-like HAD superfamily hydrolase
MTRADKPVVAIDIDGTLGDHYIHLANFAELWLGRQVKYDPHAGWPPGAKKFQFNKALGIGKSTYRQIKLAYRQGGMKRSMPVYDGASELTRSLRKMGVDLWICTSRPAYKLDTIEPDTKHWLRVNRIQYDHMIYGDYKYRDLVRQVGNENVVCVLDDLTEMITHAQRCRLPAMLIERPHNADRPWLSVSHGEMTASNLEDALSKIKRLVLEVQHG